MNPGENHTRSTRRATIQTVALLVGCCLAIFSLLAQESGFALTGNTSDPNDVAGPIDVKTVTHSETDTTITYVVEAYETWPDADRFQIFGGLDWADDEFAEVCVLVARLETGGPLSGELRNNCNSDDIIGTVAASKSGAVVTYSISRAALQLASIPIGDRTLYRYNLAVINQEEGNEITDHVPDLETGSITHTFGPDPTTSTTPTTVPPTSTTSTTLLPTTSTTSTSTTSTTSTSTSTTTTPPTSATSTTVACPASSVGTISPATVVRGGTVTYTDSAACFASGATLQAVMTSNPVNLGSRAADSAGRVSTSFSIPSNTAAGTHTITLTGLGRNGGSRTSVATFTVVTSLPRTGDSPLNEVLGGVAAILIGAALVSGARRRRVGDHWL